jgi:hypothetical protein
MQVRRIAAKSCLQCDANLLCHYGFIHCNCELEMPRRKSAGFDESGLSKGEIRKLNALRKSLGPDIAERAFAEWLATQPTAETERSDKNADLIAKALHDLVVAKNLQIPRGGYHVKRGRGRVIVTRAVEE